MDGAHSLLNVGQPGEREPSPPHPPKGVGVAHSPWFDGGRAALRITSEGV